MEALIKIPSSEFNKELFDKIKTFLRNDYGLEVTISIRRQEKPASLANESQEQYWNSLKRSVNEIREGKSTVFTMEELDEYIHKNIHE